MNIFHYNVKPCRPWITSYSSLSSHHLAQSFVCLKYVFVCLKCMSYGNNHWVLICSVLWDGDRCGLPWLYQAPLTVSSLYILVSTETSFQMKLSPKIYHTDINIFVHHEIWKKIRKQLLLRKKNWGKSLKL